MNTWTSEEKEVMSLLELPRMPLTKSDTVSQFEKTLFEAGIKAFEDGKYAIATEYFMKLVLFRNDYGVYEINKLVCAFLEQGQLFPKLFLAQFSELGRKENFNSYRFDIIDKILPYPPMVYNLCLIMRMLTKDLDSVLFVIERLQNATMPKEISVNLNAKIDVVAIDVLMEDNEYRIAYEEILRVESAYDNLEPNVIIKLQQFKVRCLVALKNFKNIKKEYKTLFALTNSGHPSYHVGSFIKAEHEYLVGNFTKAYKTIENFLNKYSTAELKEEFIRTTGDNIGMLLKNNQACCEFNIYKPATALWRLREALEEYFRHRITLTYPAYCMYQLPQVEVLIYNKAVALMYCRQYKEAIPLLSKSCRAFPYNPRLWLRLGQACLAVFNPVYESLLITPKKWIKIVKQEMSAGTLRNELYIDTVKDCVYERPGIKSNSHIPIFIFPTWKYAEICARKALNLYRGHVEDADGIKVCPCAPIYDRRARSTLRAEILAFMTHICMVNGLYHEAFTYSMEILAIENIPGYLRYMAKADIGEAATKLKDSRKADPYILEDYDIAEMLSRPTSRTESSNEPSHYVLKPIEEEWCRSADWLEAHRGLCLILYRTKTMYFYEAHEQTREWLDKLGDELPLANFVLALFLFKFTGCLDEAHKLWHKHIGQYYPYCRSTSITRAFKTIPKPKPPPKPKLYRTPRKQQVSKVSKKSKRKQVAS